MIVKKINLYRNLGDFRSAIFVLVLVFISEVSLVAKDFYGQEWIDSFDLNLQKSFNEAKLGSDSLIIRISSSSGNFAYVIKGENAVFYSFDQKVGIKGEIESNLFEQIEILVKNDKSFYDEVAQDDINIYKSMADGVVIVFSNKENHTFVLSPYYLYALTKSKVSPLEFKRDLINYIHICFILAKINPVLYSEFDEVSKGRMKISSDFERFLALGTISFDEPFK